MDIKKKAFSLISYILFISLVSVNLGANASGKKNQSKSSTSSSSSKKSGTSSSSSSSNKKRNRKKTNTIIMGQLTANNLKPDEQHKIGKDCDIHIYK